VEAKKPVSFVDLREMTVNLAPEPNQERQQFLKFRVALEVGDPKVLAEIQPLLPRVEDTFQVFLRELRATDLEGSAGTYRLREELLRRVNMAVYPAKVDAVLFKDIVVQ
jgi:flagellar FliL protein